MNTDLKENNIKSINKKALKSINNHLENVNQFTDLDKVTVPVTFLNYEDLGIKIKTMFSVIGKIANEDSNNNDLEIYHLCEIAKQIVPLQELGFIDDLIFDKTFNKNDFIELEKI